MRRSATLQIRGALPIREKQRFPTCRSWKVALLGNRVAITDISQGMLGKKDTLGTRSRLRRSATLQIREALPIRGTQRFLTCRSWRVAITDISRGTRARLRRSATLQIHGALSIRGTQRSVTYQSWRVALLGNRVAITDTPQGTQGKTYTLANLSFA